MATSQVSEPRKQPVLKKHLPLKSHPDRDEVGMGTEVLQEGPQENVTGAAHLAFHLYYYHDSNLDSTKKAAMAWGGVLEGRLRPCSGCDLDAPHGVGEHPVGPLVVCRLYHHYTSVARISHTWSTDLDGGEMLRGPECDDDSLDLPPEGRRLCRGAHSILDWEPYPLARREGKPRDILHARSRIRGER